MVDQPGSIQQASQFQRTIRYSRGDISRNPLSSHQRFSNIIETLRYEKGFDKLQIDVTEYCVLHEICDGRQDWLCNPSFKAPMLCRIHLFLYTQPSSRSYHCLACIRHRIEQCTDNTSDTSCQPINSDSYPSRSDGPGEYHNLCSCFPGDYALQPHWLIGVLSPVNCGVFDPQAINRLVQENLNSSDCLTSLLFP